MNYGDLKNHVLKLINEFSNRGTLISPAKNADALNKIGDLANDTQYDLASTVARIPAVFSITHNPVDEPFTLYDLPVDYFSFSHAMVGDKPLVNYRLRLDKKLEVNRTTIPVEITVFYWRRPAVLAFTGTDDIDNLLTFDVSEDAQRIMAYNIAGQILISDDSPAQGVSLVNQYEAKKAGLQPVEEIHQTGVIDAVGWWS